MGDMEPLNAIERAAVAALLQAMRAYRSASPVSSYRTEYTLVVNNVVACSYRTKVEAQIGSDVG